MLAFMTNKVPFLALSFLTQIGKKCARKEISTKNKICGTESINLWILADEACHFSNFSNIASC